MRIHFALVALLSVSLFVSGCASTSIKKEAFAKQPKLAVVSLYGTVHELVTDSREDVKILSNTLPTCLSEISKSRNIRLLPTNAVLSAKAYAAIKHDPSMFFESVPGYKQFNVEDEKQNLKALARELNVDGFIFLNASYARSQGGVGIGPVSFSSLAPTASVGIGAYDAAGEILWAGNVSAEAEDSSFGIGLLGITAANYTKMVGQLNELTRKVCKQAVKDLADQVAAK